MALSYLWLTNSSNSMHTNCVVYCVFRNRITKMLHVTKLLDEMYSKVDVWISIINIRRMGSYSRQFMTK